MSVPEELLAPIAGSASGCGEDLSFSEIFSQIQKARVEDEDNLAQGEWVTQRHQADWNFVRDTSARLLVDQSKDLRLAMWWVEAQTRLTGFGGFAEGLDLLTALGQRFWEHIYPEIEQGDAEARIVLLRWFTANMLEVLRGVVFAEVDAKKLSYNQLLSARNVDDLIRRQPDMEEELKQGKLTVAQFQQLLAATQAPVRQHQLQQLALAQAAWQRFTALMDERLGYDAPVFTLVNDLLNEIIQQIGKYSPAETDAASSLKDTPHASATSPVQTSVQGGAGLNLSGGNHLESRRQALEMLGKISEYFKMHEPHSPVNYLLDKAVYWADLPLHEWLREVVKQDDVLAQLQEMLSGRPSTDDSSY